MRTAASPFFVLPLRSSPKYQVHRLELILDMADVHIEMAHSSTDLSIVRFNLGNQHLDECCYA